MTAAAPQTIDAPGASLAVWRAAPTLDGLKTAALGAFSCETPEAGARVIDLAVAQLAGEGFEAVLGPMDGSTWAKHRLVVDSDGRPPFLMEPENPPYYPRAFDLAGFEVVARYTSAERSADAPPSESRPPKGVSLRNLSTADPEADLRAIHALSLKAFASNAFYVPIGEEAFLESYRPVLKFVDPELVLLAEDAKGALKGFLFAIPDYNEGRKPGTVILKTYASQAKGAGSMLANAFHEMARRKGYSRVIHALMHEDNLSATHSENTGGRVFRRYALWGRRL